MTIFGGVRFGLFSPHVLRCTLKHYCAEHHSAAVRALSAAGRPPGVDVARRRPFVSRALSTTVYNLEYRLGEILSMQYSSVGYHRVSYIATSSRSPPCFPGAPYHRQRSKRSRRMHGDYIDSTCRGFPRCEDAPGLSFLSDRPRSRE